MKKYKVSWSKTYYASGEVEILADSREEANRIAQENIGDYEGSMQYDPEGDFIHDVTEVKSIVTEMCEDVLDKARELGALSYPRDFDGAHHVNKAQERLDKFNKDNPVDNLQDLM